MGTNASKEVSSLEEQKGLIADHLTGIEKFEADLWKAADNLGANSNLASNEYFMPILGLIFLRHATNRYHHEALAAMENDKAAGELPDSPFRKRTAPRDRSDDGSYFNTTSRRRA